MMPRADEIHVWWAGLDVEPDQLRRLSATLSADELARAARYRSPRDRDRFIAGRGLLRSILGHYLMERPTDVRLDYGLRGKPQLAGPSAAARLSFNLSHSGPRALYAIAPGAAVGVDVEVLRVWEDAEDVAERFFSSHEAAALRRTPPERRAAAFLTCWTRKEAFIKARGDGMSLPLADFDVSLSAGEGAALLRTAWDPAEAGRWSLVDLSGRSPGHVAALAVRGHGWGVRWREWCQPRGGGGPCRR